VLAELDGAGNWSALREASEVEDFPQGVDSDGPDTVTPASILGISVVHADGDDGHAWAEDPPRRDLSAIKSTIAKAISSHRVASHDTQ
jgi:hypothetical protein